MVMKTFFFLLIFFLLSSCGVPYRYANSVEAKSDSSFVYALPYPKGKDHLLVQGYNSSLSHKGRRALDFKMKKGSPVLAARSGIVTAVQADAKKGGLKNKYLHNGNYVIVRHSDGTQAYYGHLQYKGALINVGDSVQQGQLIAKSGSTGYSAFPHLHFIVWGRTASGDRSSLPTRFKTRKGIKYLKPGTWYKAL
jgi:murein DD-endopeptidase MepM/ murein hydrolase activator NlpD